uniref:Pre-mRNA-processing factor 17 n=1 Tax=Pinguiococcus pyrenoidosus TaxID=172671 RepID=A0A7R9YFU6_9STRA|mmetsp:Transcript_9489/g.35527  ORF Transcript_9489/g.35527 Transcript_9489/m.35527 type:complete len:613 (+) Transcript_9489:107-1945(+)
MQALLEYGSADDDSEEEEPVKQSAAVGALARPSRAVNTRPAVDSASYALQRRRAGDYSVALRASASSEASDAKAGVQALSAVLMGQSKRNLPSALMSAPTAGPRHPFKKERAVEVNGVENMATGAVLEPAVVENYDFEGQFNSFNNQGFAIDAYGHLQGDATAVAKRPRPEQGVAKKKKRRPERAADGSLLPPALAEADDPTSLGPWAQEAEGEDVVAVRAEATSEEQAGEAVEPQPGRTAEEDYDAMVERKRGGLLPPRHNRHTQAAAPQSVFHGDNERDYQGRSWTTPPTGLRADPEGEHPCYLPKKIVHTWTGHTKGVNKIRWLPQYGHLLLSCSMDGTAKIWDVYNDRRCMRTYSGHSLGIKDIDFSPDGTKFLTTSFDRFIRLWDVETGQCVSTFTNRKMAYTVRIHPEDTHNFLAACSDNKVVQYDVNSGDIVQEYDYHLEAVNSVCYVDGNKRFISTSDDKKILVWEWGLPVPMKYINEPNMHAIHSTCLHPSGSFWVGQSMDNSIVVYQATPKFKAVGRKSFKGLVNAGYSIGLSFSPNGKFLASGDGEGRMMFYDFRSSKNVKRIRAHDGSADRGVCMDAQWHPLEPSWVASAGWDGRIKLWD